MIDAQINLMPAQQRAAAATELAQIQAETERTNVQVKSDAQTERAAYASQNPAVRAAANTTVVDAPVVYARRLVTGLVF